MIMFEFFQNLAENMRQKAEQAVLQNRTLSDKLGKRLSEDKARSLVSMGRRVMRELDQSSRQAVILQHRLLHELLEENKNTEYGRSLGFGEIHTARDYQGKVPFTGYDDYEPYIRRMIQGEKNLLSAKETVHYAMSAGSVGVPKYIPVSEAELKKITKYGAEMAFGVADEYYRCTTGKGVPFGPGLCAIEMRVMMTERGVEKGTVSGSALKSMKDFVPFVLSSPWEVVRPEGEMDLKYLKIFLALGRRDLAFMESAFLTSLVDLMDYMRDHYEMLCKDIYRGRINDDIRVSEEVRALIEENIRPDKERAKELMREFKRGFDTPIIPRIWPRMSWIGGIGTGGFTPYVRRMRQYSGKSIPFNNLCYAASESFMAVARHMGDESYVLIPDSGFYEFVPIREEEGDGRPLLMDELEIGEDYEVIVTNLSGFYRYRLQDVVRVTGYYNELPLLRFVYRKDQLLSIAGEKTNEEALRWAVEEYSLETSMHINDYSLYAETSTSPAHYVILLEPEKPVPKEKLPYCREVMDSKLMQANPSYGDKIRNGALGSAEIVFLQQQTYQLYRDLMTMKGASANQIKPVRLIDTPLKEKFFFGLKETY